MLSLLERPMHSYLVPQTILSASYRTGYLSPRMSLTQALAEGQCQESLFL